MFTGEKKRETYAREPSSQLKFRHGDVHERGIHRALALAPTLLRADLLYGGRYPGRLLIPVVLCQSNHCTMQERMTEIRETARRTFGRESRWSIARRKYRAALGHLRRGKLYHLLCATAVHFRNFRAVDARLYGIC